ncbi:hypothetical protein WJX81_005267 [Elliptochloris bilobata]|uniref:RNA helicase n=1 Tax=Elliptochloris bilobata TaxID=381761 RepID=A0AAW1RPR9_9CHLO
MEGRRGGRGRGRSRGRIAPGQRPVSETQRISIAQQLGIFQRSNERELTFQAGLSNHDRAVVHSECRKYGFTSKSYGKGDRRQVKVRKPRTSGRAHKDVFDLTFKPQALDILQRHCQQHPLTPEERVDMESDGAGGLPRVDGGGTTSGGGGAGRSRRGGGGGGEAARFTPEQVATRHATWAARQATPEAAALAASRAALPIAAFREEILAAIDSNQVVLVAGETGCGKTTQVPQYLLEQAWAAGRGCRIMCTQPRRISAISIAERVAVERGERCGENVGYTIRLESSGGPASSLMFCTNGVLLRMLTHGEGLATVTHIIVDEIHERDRFADFLLVLVRRLLPAHPALRVLLMSATLHVELFSGYFDGCPVVRVPGFTHPVQDFYLEDVLALLDAPAPAEGSGGGRGRVEAAILQAFMHGQDADFDLLLEVTGAASLDDGDAGAPCINLAHPETGATPLMAAAGKGRLADAQALLASGADPLARARDGSTAADWAASFGHADVAEALREHAQAAQHAQSVAASALALSEYQAGADADEVDLELVQSLLEHICGEGHFARPGEAAPTLGAVLIFLPGWDEIMRLKDRLESSDEFGSGRYQVLPLHSMVPAADQRRVFVRPPRGMRKLVLATNIAETAVTIDDVVCVINSGRHKEKSYDPYTNVSTLQAAWVSKASERQRRGRAGRCQKGICFHLYSRARSAGLSGFQVPELQRSPLDELCLQVKLLEGRGFGETHVASFLEQAVEPPPAAAVANALRLLEAIGALEERTERLTVLGRHLAALPLPPRVGKMLLYGVLFGCLDPVLTVACCMAYRDPWVLPLAAGARQAAQAARAALAAGAGCGSDHLALVCAFNGWAAARAGGRGGERRYAAQHSVSGGTMAMVEGMRAQLLGELMARGFTASLASASRNAADAGLVRSVLAAGFYPQVGRLLPASDGAGRERKGAVILTAKQEKVRVHASSVNSGLSAPAAPQRRSQAPRPCPLMIFEEVTRTESQLGVRQCTAVNPHVLPLVAAHVRPQGRRTNDWDALGGSSDGGRDSDGGAPASGAANGRLAAIALGNGAGAGNGVTAGERLLEAEAPMGGSEDGSSSDEGEEDEADEGNEADEADGLDEERLPAAGGGHRGRGQRSWRGAGDEEGSETSSYGDAEHAKVVVDGWLTLRVPGDALSPLLCLRRRLAACFDAKVAHPREPLSAAQTDALRTAAALFSLEAGGAGSGASLGAPPHTACAFFNQRTTALVHTM